MLSDLAHKATGVLAALDNLHTAARPVLEADIREVRPDYIAAVLQSFREDSEPDGPGVPVFGWRTFHPVAPETTWEDTIDVAAWNSSLMMCGMLEKYDQVPELQPVQLADLLRHHGIPAVLCAACGAPITNRHPRWNGVWITPERESGPLCETRQPTLAEPSPMLGRLTDNEFGDPHRPAPGGQGGRQ
ncbi:hypothetical protein [Streptomyces violaceusniger]|uniref:hypothetical protein n=1 Tax=Streptomyces violaceusniger TaxID=68280 RepID=UPI0005BDB0BA|nr:hypothetical protein [Streptomyces violaceusniger]